MKGFTKDLYKLLPAFKKYPLIEKQDNQLRISDEDKFEDNRFKNKSLMKARMNFLSEVYGKNALKGLHPERVYVKCSDIINFLLSEGLINKSTYNVVVTKNNNENQRYIVRYDEFNLSKDGLTKVTELDRVITAKRSLCVSAISLILSVVAVSISFLKN